MDSIIQKASRPKSLLILAVIFILSLVYTQFKNSREESNTLSQKYLAAVTPTVSMQPTSTRGNTAQSKNLDINGTYVCNYASTSATIHQKQLYLESKTATMSSYMVFKGDCLYSWTSKKYVGQKKCGLGQYMSMLEGAASLGLADTSSMIGMLMNSGLASKLIPATDTYKVAPGTKKKPQNVTENLANSCNAVSRVDENLFNVPKNVIFKQDK